MKTRIHIILFASALLLVNCKNEPADENAESALPFNREADSLSRLSQKRVSDSLKQLNPLLILPPDSSYSGAYIDKYPNGVIKFRGTFRFGERHGQWLSFYPNGTLWSEMHYDNGLRHGPNITYFENGKVRYSGFYKNDKVDSVWTYNDSTGKSVQSLVYRNNKLLRRKTIP